MYRKNYEMFKKKFKIYGILNYFMIKIGILNKIMIYYCFFMFYSFVVICRYF